MYSPRKTIQNTPKNAKNWKLKKFPFEMVSLLWGGDFHSAWSRRSRRFSIHHRESLPRELPDGKRWKPFDSPFFWMDFWHPRMFQKNHGDSSFFHENQSVSVFRMLWGLLDFMSVSSPPPLLLFFSSSSSSPCPPQLATGILWVQCGVLDWPNGPQLRSSEFSVACWTPTAILWVQCGVLDPNRDLVSSVWRAGPQPRYCEFSVACWTPTAILRVECGVLDPRKSGQRSSCKMSQDKSDRVSADMFARRSERMCQREWSKICQECQKRMFG